VDRHGGWNRLSSSGAWAGTLIGTGRAGATASLAFTGHAIAWVGPNGPHRGKARVYIDGVYATTISMRSATSRTRQIAFTRFFPKGGSHSITVRVVGGGKYPGVRLDAFLIGR
jgi:hypothetical protein